VAQVKLALTISEPLGGSPKMKATKLDVDVTRAGQQLRIVRDGIAIEADARRISPGIYSILIGSRSFEARIDSQRDGLHVHIGAHEFVIDVADPRASRGRRGGVLEAEGRQEILAPMPGKIVRLLVEQGAKVEAGQGVLVVEAMKMQNEIRSPKTGTIEKLFVKEGVAVTAGETLAVVV
jgi:acetyl/propionyl-CoA carboxylase alpha subunit